MKSTVWFVYIIETERGHLYTGITTDLKRRFEEHASSKKGAKFFRSSAPVKLVFSKKMANRSEASRYEAAIKKLPRSSKLKLIKGVKVWSE
jgi:putative endonuclease